MMSPVFVVIGLVIGIVVAAGGLRVALWGPHARARRRLAEGRAQIADRSIGYRDAPTRVRIVAHTDHPLTIGVPR